MVIICKEKKESKKELRRCIRVELAKQRDEERELIMETKTIDMRLFHKLVHNNRKKGNEVKMDLKVNVI
jgi:flagellar biosynthesis regulator FlaF